MKNNRSLLYDRSSLLEAQQHPLDCWIPSDIRRKTTQKSVEISAEPIGVLNPSWKDHKGLSNQVSRCSRRVTAEVLWWGCRACCGACGARGSRSASVSCGGGARRSGSTSSRCLGWRERGGDREQASCVRYNTRERTQGAHVNMSFDNNINKKPSWYKLRSLCCKYIGLSLEFVASTSASYSGGI